MQDIQPLRLSTHGALRWTPASSYSFAAETIFMPIALDELARVVTSLPLAFTPGETTGLVALTGLTPGQNLFVAPNGRWIGDYVPATLRVHPFKLLRATGDQFALGFDHASGLLAAPGQGEEFFTADGKPSQKINVILQTLLALDRGVKRTAEAGKRLTELGLLEPWPIRVQHQDGGATPIEGLLRINEAALAKLGDADFLTLRQGGVMALIYAQLLSMANITKLPNLARMHAREASQHQHAIQSIFDTQTDDEHIDWDAILKN